MDKQLLLPTGHDEVQYPHRPDLYTASQAHQPTPPYDSMSAQAVYVLVL